MSFMPFRSGAQMAYLVVFLMEKEEFARLIKTERTAKGYTQQELSDLTGISLRSIQRIEKAEVMPHPYTVKQLAAQLGFDWQGAVDRHAAEPYSSPSSPSTPEAPPAFTRQPLQKSQKRILSVIVGILLSLLAAAFLAQSSRFPETQFELLLFLSGVIVVYGIFLFWLWK